MAEDLNSWEDFTGSSFLKAANVTSESDAFTCTNVEIFKDPKEPSNIRPRLTLVKAGTTNEYLMDLNMTNANFLKNAGITSPSAIKGRKIFFKKVLVRDPRKNVEIEGLRIARVE